MKVAPSPDPLVTGGRSQKVGKQARRLSRIHQCTFVLVAMISSIAWTSVDSDRYETLVNLLASPAFEGRGAGTEGLDRARRYLARQFHQVGLSPAFGASILGQGRAYVQSFEITTGVQTRGRSLQVRGTNKPEYAEIAPEHFNALGFSGNGDFEGPLAFVGYGVVAPEFNYDSYHGAGPELKDRVFVAFRFEPRDRDGHSRWTGLRGHRGRWTRAADLTVKAEHAQAHGASALLLIDPPSFRFGPLKTTLGSFISPAARIPVLHLSREVFESWLSLIDKDAARRLKTWQQLADQNRGQVQLIDQVIVRGRVELEVRRARVANVAGIVKGSGSLSNQLIVVGAHYDHLGYGGLGSVVKGHQIHPGADDNASGTAALPLLADAFAKAAEYGPSERRAILFVAFTAEEQGLLGSQHLLKHARNLGISKSQIFAMINLDMVGRMKGNKLFVIGADTSAAWRSMITSASNRVGLKTVYREERSRTSDHAAFHEQGIPAIHLFTGVHEDYHRPSDTAVKINVPSALKVVAVAETLIETLWDQYEPFAFVPSRTSSRSISIFNPPQPSLP